MVHTANKIKDIAVIKRLLPYRSYLERSTSFLPICKIRPGPLSLRQNILFWEQFAPVLQKYWLHYVPCSSASPRNHHYLRRLFLARKLTRRLVMD
jgi:hypothetical protein